MLLLMKSGAIKQGLIGQLRSLWKMSTEVDLTVKTPFTFLGLELEKDDSGDLHVHQRDFIRKILRENGFDTMSRGNSAVTMALPTAEDPPPNATELKQLQKHAGEFNWLATRTRPDLAYYTSLIASASKDHGPWALELCKKVLRYLVNTRDQGLVFPKAGSALSCGGPSLGAATIQDGGSELHSRHQLTVWSDAGYGGVGTKAQTGVLISWAGAVVLARSSRQTNSAMSTCEAEVAAAAMAFVCCEGLRALLEEWGQHLDAPILLVDNKSALTVLELGGSWRTRYFAVRAARIAEEFARERVQLRYCETKAMAADGLTKLAASAVMDMLREAMSGRFPALAPPTSNFTKEDPNWWGGMLRAFTARSPTRAELALRTHRSGKTSDLVHKRPLARPSPRQTWPQETQTDTTTTFTTTSGAHPGAARASGEVSTHWRTSGGIAPVDPPTVTRPHGTRTSTTTTTATQTTAAAVDEAKYREDSEDKT